MKYEIEKLFEEGDDLLKESKSKFYLQKEEHCGASCSCCCALKKYLDAYEMFLFEFIKPSENYHVLLHTITQKDPEFNDFNEKIFKVKCFADESKKEGEGFFIYPDEVNDVLKIVVEIRNYIGKKVGLSSEFLQESRKISEILAL